MCSNIPISKTEIEACQDAVRNFRVHELHQLVSNFKYPKIGKKQELVSRGLSILSNSKYQVQAVQKVREIQASNRVRETSQPYSVPSTTSGIGINNILSNGVTNNTMNQQNNPYMNAQNIGAANFPGFNTFMNAYAANVAAYGHHFAGAPGMHGFSHSMPQLNQQHVVPMQHSSGLVKNLRFVELPFYDQMKVIYQMTELPAYPVPTRPGEARYDCKVYIPAEDIPKLTYSENHPLPRFELQMRMFLLEVSEEQQDAFPPGTTVRLDDYNVNLPPVIPTNKPNAEQKRYSRPVNITPYCRPPRGRDRPHRLHIEWNGDKRAWAFTITLVKRLNSDILLERMRDNPNATRPFDKTKEAIIRRLNGTDEDDVQMDSLKISLIDPLGRIRMKIPSRAADCTHLQSFDLYNYLMMNEKRPGWRCPVCDNNAIYSKLIIDEYFEKMLSNIGNSVEEVELLKNGSWRIPQVENMVSLDSDEGESAPMDDDEEIMIVEKPIKGEKKKSEIQLPVQQPTATANITAKNQQLVKQPQERAKASAPPKDNDLDIICLSSDDEEEQLASAIAASHMNINATSSAGTPNSNSSANGCADASNSPSKEKRIVTTGDNQQQRSRINASITTGRVGIPNGTTVVQAQQNGQHSGSATPVLQTNDQQPTIFRPIIDEIAKTQVAQNLALFLHNVYTKNNQFPTPPPSIPTSNNNN